MRLVIQKVSQSNVKVDGKIVGEIGKGYMVLVGITEGDDEKIVDKMVDKLVNLRIFEDTENKMNLSLIDIGGSIYQYHNLHYMQIVKKDADQVL